MIFTTKPYQNSTTFSHDQPEKIGILITNLGTPAEPTAKALRPYLKEFLSDPRVVEFPRWAWWLILNGIILNVRPKKSAAAYKKIWTQEGSPLAVYTQQQAQAVSKSLGDGYVVEWAMRYGTPSISRALQSLQDKGARKILVLPLYPQYSGATTGSTFDALAHDFIQRRWLPELRFISSYHDHPKYIEAIASSIESHWQEHGRSEKLLLSYHGVPLRYLHQGDPYHCQCLKTSRLIAEKLNLDKSKYLTCFQSRFGREEWLRPYTDQTIKSLAQQKTQSIDIICPGFASDCLETLEEIAVENREVFMQNGGQTFNYIPALNASQQHIHFLTTLIHYNIQGWQIPAHNLSQRAQRASSCPNNQKS